MSNSNNFGDLEVVKGKDRFYIYIDEDTKVEISKERAVSIYDSLHIEFGPKYTPTIYPEIKPSPPYCGSLNNPYGMIYYG